MSTTSRARRRQRRILPVLIALFSLAFISCATTADAQQTGESPESTLEKERVLSLVFDHEYVEAIPLLEKLVRANPEDLIAIELLSCCLFSTSPVLAEGTQERKDALLRSRELAQKAKGMGSTDIMVDLILGAVSDQGEFAVSFSREKTVDDLMKQGEVFFAQNDMDRAREAYLAAAALDPMLYDAPLFVGDCYFVQKRPTQALEWYARAIAIDPNQETAYRWSGDALMQQDKMAEAKASYIDAIVAMPYDALPWNGLRGWAARNVKQIGHYRFKIPVTVNSAGELLVDDESLNPKNGTSCWVVYGAARVTARNLILAGIASGKVPENENRHSLGEEAFSIRVMLRAVKEKIDQGELKSADLDWPILLLRDLNDQGLLAAYILLEMADEEISKDYEAYRNDNREAIRRYIDLFVIHDKK